MTFINVRVLAENHQIFPPVKIKKNRGKKERNQNIQLILFDASPVGSRLLQTTHRAIHITDIENKKMMPLFIHSYVAGFSGAFYLHALTLPSVDPENIIHSEGCRLLCACCKYIIVGFLTKGHAND